MTYLASLLDSLPPGVLDDLEDLLAFVEEGEGIPLE